MTMKKKNIETIECKFKKIPTKMYYFILAIREGRKYELSQESIYQLLNNRIFVNADISVKDTPSGHERGFKPNKYTYHTLFLGFRAEVIDGWCRDDYVIDIKLVDSNNEAYRRLMFVLQNELNRYDDNALFLSEYVIEENKIEKIRLKVYVR